MSKDDAAGKKGHILNAAIELFAVKGYHATTMQDISHAAGIAKGSVYSYFTSKEQLLISIYCEYTARRKEELQALDDDTGCASRQKLRDLIAATFSKVTTFRHFIMMQIRESTALMGSELKRILIDSHQFELNWYRARICEIYGDDMTPYAMELAASIHALVRDYLVYLLLDDTDIDSVKLSQSLLNRLDDLAQGMLARRDTPYITIEGIKHRMNKVLHGESAGGSGQTPKYWIDQLRKQIDTLQTGDEWDRKEMESAVDLLENEWAKESPRKVMIKSLIAYFKALQLDADLPEVKILASLAEQLSE